MSCTAAGDFANFVCEKCGVAFSDTQAFDCDGCGAGPFCSNCAPPCPECEDDGEEDPAMDGVDGPVEEGDE